MARFEHWPFTHLQNQPTIGCPKINLLIKISAIIVAINFDSIVIIPLEYCSINDLLTKIDYLEHSHSWPFICLLIHAFIVN